jgi:hypothetical protein
VRGRVEYGFSQSQATGKAFAAGGEARTLAQESGREEEPMVEVTKIARDAEYAELSGESTRPIYNAAIRTVIAEVRARQVVLRELLVLRRHAHRWITNEETGHCYCDQCGADGDA